MEQAKVSSGRHNLWTRMFAEHHASLSGYFRRRVNERSDAEDLAQEVYLRLLRSDGGDRATILNPEAYLYTIASNLAREHAIERSRSPIAAVDIDHVAETVADEHVADEAFDRAQRRRRLAEVIEALPAKSRAVLLMQYRDDLTYREIAERLKVSTHMVKKHVVKALALCRRELGDGA